MREMYTEKGLSTRDKMGEYVITLILNDGYLFGPNETTYTLKVTITPKINTLPIFGEPGLTPQSFPCEAAFVYELPPIVDVDGD